MKSSFQATILLVCALIAAFSVGYFFRDAQEPESALRGRQDGGRMTLASAPRRTEIVRPADPDEEDTGAGRFSGSNPQQSSGAWASTTNGRPSQDDADRFAAATVPPMSTMPQMRTLVLPTFYVPVRGGRPPLSDSEKKTDKEREEETPTQRVASYALFGLEDEDDEVFSTLKELLIGEEKEVTVEKADTMSDGIASEAEVLILVRGLGSSPELTRELIEPFKKRKVLGIGIGAARLFDRAGLKIGSFNMVFGSAGTPLIAGPGNSVADLGEAPVSVFAPPPGINDRSFRKSVFAYVLGSPNSLKRDGVEVIAHWQGDQNFAPIVRQGNTVLIGINGRISKWSPEFRELVRKVASGLARR